MSFEQASNLESQSSPWADDSDAPYNDFPEFQAAQRRLETKINDTRTRTKKITQLANRIGTARENKDDVSLLQKVINENKDDFVVMNGDVVTIKQKFPDLGLPQQRSLNELTMLIQDGAKAFQSASEAGRNKLSASRTALEAEINPSGSAGHNGQQQQLMERERVSMANQYEVDYNAQLIAQREEQIADIAEGVDTINSLVKMIGQSVHEQGETIDNIYDNVESTAVDTQQANVQLKMAANHQRRARSTKCCLLIIFAVILTVVILAIVID